MVDGNDFRSFQTEQTKSNVNVNVNININTKFVVDQFPFSDIDYPDLALINHKSYCLNFTFPFLNNT